jgi:hypothetical protein
MILVFVCDMAFEAPALHTKHLMGFSYATDFIKEKNDTNVGGYDDQ